MTVIFWGLRRTGQYELGRATWNGTAWQTSQGVEQWTNILPTPPSAQALDDLMEQYDGAYLRLEVVLDKEQK